MRRHVAGRRGGLDRDLPASPPQPPGNRAGGPEGGDGKPRLNPPPQPAEGCRQAKGTLAKRPPRQTRGAPPPPHKRRGTRGGAPRASTPPPAGSHGDQSRAGAQKHPADRIRGQHADTNRSSMETTTSMN